MMTFAMRPVFSSPMRVHVLPASDDLKIPSPTEMWLRMHDSPVPAQIVFGSVGAIARSPIECTVCPSKMGCQLSPPSVVLKIPPDAEPA
jgi:hypothetical protein